MKESSFILFVIIVIIILLLIFAFTQPSKPEKHFAMAPYHDPSFTCHNTVCTETLVSFNENYSSRELKEIYWYIELGSLDSRKDPNIPSYFSSFIDSETTTDFQLITSGNPSGVYSVWCMDVNDTINIGQLYNAHVISLLDPNIISIINSAYHCSSNPIYTTYLDALIAIVNMAQNYIALGYTVNDIQVAIWSLLFNAHPTTDTPVNDGMSYTLANVQAIIASAIAAQNAYLANGDVCQLVSRNIGALLVISYSPITSGSGCNQILLLEVSLTDIDDAVLINEWENSTHQYSSLGPNETTWYIESPGSTDVRKNPDITSYVNGFITSETATDYKLITTNNPNGMYSVWSMDTHDTINTGQLYIAEIISLFDSNIVSTYREAFSCDRSRTLYTTYLIAIVQILNEAQNYEAIGYTSNDIQVAIWSLLFNAHPATDTPFSNSLSYNSSNVTTIINNAIAAQTAYHSDHNIYLHILTTGATGFLVISKSPVTSGTGCDRIMCIQAQIADTGNDCGECKCE